MRLMYIYTTFREIKTPNDCDTLQDDLKKLAKWSDDWLMSFNIKRMPFNVYEYDKEKNQDSALHPLQH